MAVWHVPVDLLARSRFAISPMTDTVAALKALQSPYHPWQHAWQRPHQAAYQQMLARRPMLRALLAAAFRHRWFADFFTIAPASAAPTFAEELAAVGERSDEQIRADLRAGPRPNSMKCCAGTG
ncbi:DUF5937 family protein [Catellatospora coxensis]